MGVCMCVRVCTRARVCVFPGTDFLLRSQQAFLYHWRAMAPLISQGSIFFFFLDVQEDDSIHDLALLSPSCLFFFFLTSAREEDSCLFSEQSCLRFTKTIWSINNICIYGLEQ